MAWTAEPQGFDAVKKMGPAVLSLGSPHECGILVRHPLRADRIQGGAADRCTDVARLIPILSSTSVMLEGKERLTQSTPYKSWRFKNRL
jgi:hypothetical protein